MPNMEEETAEQREAREAEEARVEAMMERFARAMRHQPQDVVYDDFQMKDDFTLWLQGYREKIRSAYGYTVAQETEVNDEVVRSISGKLKPGTPLDAYNRLTPAVKASYTLLTEKLTSEFVDPQEKRNFLKNFAHNKRKKSQSIQEFMQAIVNDQNKFSGMPDKITVGGQEVENDAKVRDGIRRFATGMRDRRGKKNRGLKEVLDFGLLEDEDFTWENAVNIAVRWENSHPIDSETESSSSPSGEEGDGAGAAVAEDCRGAREKKKKKKKRSANQNADVVACNEATGGMCLDMATLANQVEENSRDIAELRSNMARMETDMAIWKEGATSTLNQILHIVGGQHEEQPQHYQGTFYYH